jgi:fumarate hydratase subunit beta
MTHHLTLPVSTDDARRLRVGEILFLTGTVFTARDEAHLQMLEQHNAGHPIPFDPSQMALFHCGPVVVRRGDGWDVIAAGPTTSVRMELFEDEFLRAFRTPIVIGKGGMGQRTQAALEEVGAVYTHYTGGAGALAAKRIERVRGVEWLERLGMPEAAWLFEVREFGPLLVTMDSAGGNLYKDLEPTVAQNVKEILAQIDRAG